jgi:hypothetical protein
MSTVRHWQNSRTDTVRSGKRKSGNCSIRFLAEKQAYENRLGETGLSGLKKENMTSGQLKLLNCSKNSIRKTRARLTPKASGKS